MEIIMSDISREEYDKIILDLHEEYPITEHVKFCEFDLHDKLEKNGDLILMYNDLLIKEEAYLEKIENLMDKLLGERYDYYRFESEKNLQKPEIEKYYLPKDPKILAMKNIITKQNIRVKFFKMCVNALNKVGWSMKTYSDNMRRGY